MKVKMILPALTEATGPFWRPIKYSLFPPLGLATLAAFFGDGDDVEIQDEHVEPLDVDDERVVGVHRVSAVTGEGIDHLKRALFESVPSKPESSEGDSGLVDFLVYRPEPRRRPFRVLRTDRGYRVVGRPPAGEALEQALRAAGVKQGDEVEVGGDVQEYR